MTNSRGMNEETRKRYLWQVMEMTPNTELYDAKAQ